MIHSNEAFIESAMDELFEGKHECCLEAASDSWAKAMTEEKCQLFFSSLIAKACYEHKLTEDEFEGVQKIISSVLVMSLAVGTVCGSSFIHQTVGMTYEAIATALKDYMKDRPFFKKGPKGTV